ncbi:hypothetical protein ASD64_07170 [Mesorhizobium sp. Root157]|uniref:3TM-type holin n=1 Tax=Mesorhizobium sp. Root157 TaxID=1736477 RepID=UPI0006FB36B7|nr:3TM-type holin [Mesorhizobium sp. Root157]KQZ87212.1 hypothetical protein ASD64_07170 [Mesorhizobium sp. Root157]
MSTFVASILVDAAAKVGAPIVKGLLEKYLGGAVGEVGGMIVDTIAGHAGVTADELPSLPADKIEAAVAVTEAQAPDLLIQWNVQQRQAHDLMRAEMDKGGATWTWAWRPAWMWGLLVAWAWYVFVVPMLNLFVALMGASARLVLLVDIGTLLAVTGIFTAFYMGGHTIKDGLSKWLGRAL